MSLEKLRLLSLLIIGASIAAYLSGDFGPGFFIVQICITLPLWFSIDLDRIRGKPFWKGYGLATFATFIGCILLRVDMKTSVFFLVLFCLIFELYGERRPRAPVRIIGLLSFLIVIHQARIQSGLNLLFGVSIYLFSVIFCLTGFHLGKAYGFKLTGLVREKLGSIVAHALWIFPIGLAIYWTMPRLPQQSLTTLPSLIGDRISGFSDRVTLNDIGSLKLSRKHVMDLKPLSGVLHSRFLKGRVLDHYENGVWSTSVFHNDYPRTDDQFRYPFSSQTKGNLFEYRVDLEAIHGNTIFFFDELVDLKINLPQLQVSGGLTHISVPRPFPMALSYTMTASDSPGHYRRGLQKRHYLQVPDRHEYFKTVSDQVLTGPEELSTSQMAGKLWQFFQRNFRYTLEIQNRGVRDPLQEFLLNRKEGHCELFASAMVLMLRSQGIQARLVTGFFLSEPHPSGEFYYITESDAHAWVEYLDQGSWHTIDPTPPGQFSKPGFAETQIALLKRFWRTMILTWDFDAQKEHLQRTMLWFGSAKRWLGEHWLFLTGFLGALLGLAFLFLPGSAHRRNDALAATFRKLEDLLQCVFQPRAKGEGIYDYVERLPLKPELRFPLLRFLHGYHRYYFAGDGHDPLRKPGLIREGKSLVRQLKTYR